MSEEESVLQGPSGLAGLPMKELLLYKLDRTLAIFGVIVLGVLATIYMKTPEGAQLAMACVAGLVGYVGGRTGK